MRHTLALRFVTGLLIALALLAPITSPSAEAKDTPQLPISAIEESLGITGGWEIGYSKTLASCVATATFEGGVRVWIGHSPVFATYIGFGHLDWSSVRRNGTYRGRIDTRGSGVINTTFFGLPLEQSGVYIAVLSNAWRDSLNRASGVHFSIDGQRLASPSMSGSREAIRDMMACASARVQQARADYQQNVDASKSASAATAPMPSGRPQPKERDRKGESTGTGFFVTGAGHVMTNQHVVKGCTDIQVTPSGDGPTKARLLAVDSANDLAVLATDLKPLVLPALRKRVRVGESVAVYGFPLAGLLSNTGNFTLGNVTALAGLSDNSSQMQISAPVQPGNSGGPLTDSRGNVIGVIVSKLNVLGVAQLTKDVAQNVNFAIKAAIVVSFLDSNGLDVIVPEGTAEMTTPDLAEWARQFTVRVTCR
jgi:serine protease Do